MPRLTKRRALEICIEMWDWLAEHPHEGKRKAIKELNLSSAVLGLARCSACDYAKQMKESIIRKGLVAKSTCHYCPMWTGKEKCFSSSSTYSIWEENFSYPSRARARAAKDIANLAREKLAKRRREMHTKGPWKVHKHPHVMGELWLSVINGAWDITHNSARNPGVIADARYSAMSDEENLANANLISAAPELLEALETLLGDYKYACDEWVGDAQVYGLELIDIAEKAIAKAKGEVKANSQNKYPNPSSYISPLVNGNIPAGKKCPWKNQCIAEENGHCNREFVACANEFSCASARAFDFCKTEPDSVL